MIIDIILQAVVYNDYNKNKKINNKKKQHLTWENVDVAKKGKPLERDWISFNSSTNRRHENQLCQSKNW